MMTADAPLPIHAEIPATMNGMMFGPIGGIAITWLGAPAGASLSFGGYQGRQEKEAFDDTVSTRR